MKLTEHNEKVLEKFATMIINRMEQMKSGDWKQGWIGRTYGGSPHLLHVEAGQQAWRPRQQGCQINARNLLGLLHH